MSKFSLIWSLQFLLIFLLFFFWKWRLVFLHFCNCQYSYVLQDHFSKLLRTFHFLSISIHSHFLIELYPVFLNISHSTQLNIQQIQFSTSYHFLFLPVAVAAFFSFLFWYFFSLLVLVILTITIIFWLFLLLSASELFITFGDLPFVISKSVGFSRDQARFQRSIHSSGLNIACRNPQRSSCGKYRFALPCKLEINSAYVPLKENKTFDIFRV